MAMVEPDERFTGAEQPRDLPRAAEERCLEAEQRCFRAERRRFEAERRREQVEALLAEARKAGIRMEQIVTELKGLAARLREASQLDAGVSSGPVGPTREALPGDSREQMVDALSAAIGRLRANVQAVEAAPRPARQAVEAATRPARQAVEAAPRPARQADSLTARPAVAVRAAVSPPPRPAHKHSSSWIARMRARRKQRR